MIFYFWTQSKRSGGHRLIQAYNSIPNRYTKENHSNPRAYIEIDITLYSELFSNHKPLKMYQIAIIETTYGYGVRKKI